MILKVYEPIPTPDPTTCIHDHFFFSPYLSNLMEMTKEEKDNLPGVFKCGKNCGYWMCFDPNKYPKGIGYTTYARNLTAEGKEPVNGPILSTEGKY